MKTLPRGSAALVALSTMLALSSCADDVTDATAGSTTPPPSSTSASASAGTSQASPESPAAEPASPTRKTFEVKTPRVTLRTTLIAAERFRTDNAYAGRLHLLGLPAAEGAAYIPWADMFLYAPTQVYKPGTQKLRALPDNLVAWLSANPGVRVVRSRTYQVNGAPVHELNVERDGSVLFAGDRSDDMPGALERYLLVRLDGTWVVGQASTFDGERALRRPAGRNDVLLGLVRTTRLVGRG